MKKISVTLTAELSVESLGEQNENFVRGYLLAKLGEMPSYTQHTLNKSAESLSLKPVVENEKVVGGSRMELVIT